MADADLPVPSPETEVAAPTRTIPRARMALLFCVMLTTAAGNTAMQSVMPSIGTDLGVADVWISVAYTWSALLWVICAPFWAHRSDRRGRKAMMALGLTGFIASFGLCGLVLWFGLAGAMSALWTLLLFALARSLYGLLGSAAPPAVQAYVASRTPRTERTAALALIASSFGLGTVIGPAVAPLLVFGSLGLIGPFVFFALFGALVLVLLRLRMPDDDPMFAARGAIVAAPFSAGSNQTVRSSDSEEEDRPADSVSAPAVEAPRLSWFDARLRPWLVAGLFGGHAQAALLGVVGFLVLDRLGLRGNADAGAGPIGLVLMAGAIATLLAQWGLIPMLKLGPRLSVLWGAALAAAGTLLVGAGQDLHAIALGTAIASLGFGLFRPGFTSGASLAVSRSEQGRIGGMVASVNGMAYIFAPALGVLLYGWSDWLGFGFIIVLCLATLALGWRSLASDEALGAAED